MSKIYTYQKIEMTQKEGIRTRYIIKQKTKNNENLIIELSNCNWGNLQDLWLEHGYIKKKLKNWVHIDVEAVDEDGYPMKRYNPQILLGTHKLNFNWILEDTKQNRIKILNKIAELAELKGEE